MSAVAEITPGGLLAGACTGAVIVAAVWTWATRAKAADQVVGDVGNVAHERRLHAFNR